MKLPKPTYCDNYFINKRTETRLELVKMNGAVTM